MKNIDFHGAGNFSGVKSKEGNHDPRLRPFDPLCYLNVLWFGKRPGQF